MSDAPSCPCDVFVHPVAPFNPPGLPEIDYRTGDFSSFRRALLRSLPGEEQLVVWRPSARTDLALQMVEWWAYLADILTLYNERAANESYLRTADLPESLNRLIRLLGYRPRPGIAAHGLVAALATDARGATLPAGFQIQSKPGPGKKPQIFELGQAATVSLPDAVGADPPADGSLVPSGGEPGALLDGTVTTIKPGDRLLVVDRGWPGTGGSALTTAQQVLHQSDPRGRPQTLIVFSDGLPGLSNPQAADHRLLAAPTTAHVWPYAADPAIQNNAVHLDAIVRGIEIGSPVLIEVGSSTSKLVSVTGISELIWFANGDQNDPTKTTSLPANQPAIPIPHTELGFTPAFTSWGSDKTVISIRHSWREVGTLVPRPATGLSGETEATFTADGGTFPAAGGKQVLLEDGAGAGALGTAESGGTGSELTLDDLSGADGLPPTLAAPIRALFDVLPVSRGQTVAGESLGTGDATQPSQEFALKKSPLTYLQSGPDVASTLRVWVGGLEWKEAPSFYGQAKDAQVFVTREDEQNVTHVMFGDGVEGARLPSGAAVVATYRYGSGKDVPAAGALSVIVKPVPGLKSIRSPLPVGGGSDADPPAQIRRYAPRSVLTFGRAISEADYEAIAASAPGVGRARAYWTWDVPSQRTLVKVYVGDDGAAVTSARIALLGAEDPNRPLDVIPATAVPIFLFLAVEVDPRYVADTVIAGVRSALLDADTGLFGVNVVRIGATAFRSQISRACLSVAGAVAIHDLEPWVLSGGNWHPESGAGFSPGEGGFFQLTDDLLWVVEGVAPGAA